METTKKELPFGLRLLKVLIVIAGVIILLTILGNVAIAILTKDILGTSDLSYLDLGYLSFNFIYAVILVRCIDRPSQSLYETMKSVIIIDIVACTIFLVTGYQGLATNIVSIVINLWTLWYLLNLKTYFITGVIDKDDPKIKSIDKKFTMVFVTLLILSFLIPVMMGLQLAY